MYRTLSVGILVLLLSTACNTAPVLEERTPSAMRVDSPEAMHDVVVWSLLEKGWTIESETEWQVVASVQAGQHEAVVAVDFDGRGFVIKHVRSTPGLLYRGTTVHKRYNRWVAKLAETIRTRIRYLGY